MKSLNKQRGFFEILIILFLFAVGYFIYSVLDKTDVEETYQIVTVVETIHDPALYSETEKDDNGEPIKLINESWIARVETETETALKCRITQNVFNNTQKGDKLKASVGITNFSKKEFCSTASLP